ncbi:MAG: endonuclease V [Bauldia sp.]|nr:endonuclease V [Bauldia sp.]
MDYSLATDVHYDGDGRAVAAGIAFADWTSDRIARTEIVPIADVAPYRPGHFYERELPCLLTLLERLDPLPATILVDGYVTLGTDGRDGLGAHLHRALDGRVPVIGIAKTRFAGTPAGTEIYRGRSTRPLYVTSRGIALDEAKRLVRAMHGRNRLPTLVAAADRACREASQAASLLPAMRPPR